MPSKPLFVTGTDTEVGKTCICIALLRVARAQGLHSSGFKPVATGCTLENGEWRSDDALELIEMAGSDLDYATINPVALEPAIAAHSALVQVGRRVSAAELARHCRRIASEGADLVRVEGAGGWLVPLNSRETLTDVCIALEADVILVVGMKLGCLNHALLTVAAVESAGPTSSRSSFASSEPTETTPQ